MKLYNSNLESTLLGCFVDQPKFTKYINTIKEDLFYHTKNKEIFRKIVELRRKKIPVSLPLLCSNLPQISPSYIVSLGEGTHRLSEEQIKGLIDQLSDYRRQRRIWTLSQQIQSAVERNEDPEVIDALIQEIKTTGEKMESVSDSTIDDVIQSFKEYRKKGEGIKLGIPSLDRVMRGIGEGEVMYLLGRAKVAKSALIQNILRHFSIHYPQHGAIFFSLEMPAPQLGERILTIETDKSRHEIGDLPPEVIQQIKMRHGNIFYITPILSIRGIYQAILQCKFKADIKLIAIDFLQKIKTNISGEYDFLRKATGTLKEIAKELKIAIIGVSQTGRVEGGYGWIPLTMQSGRGSGTIEEDADFILGVYRPELNPNLDEMQKIKWKDIVMLQFLGSRRTETIPDLRLQFNKESLRIYELEEK